MNKILSFLYYWIVRFSLSLRYRIKIKGIEKLTKEALPRSGGILFLANHPAEIDPCILLRTFWQKFHIHPVAVEYLFHMPMVGYFLHFVGAVSVPSFAGTSNSFKRKEIEKTFEKIYSLLDQKENVLIYPAGYLKSQGAEMIGGASGVYKILQERPETNVVLVRSRGLWGSSFSKALTGVTPHLFSVFLKGFQTLLRNGIFFAPRREVEIECEEAPADFPWGAEKKGLNEYLEKWYNREGPEPLTLVSSSWIRKVFPKVAKMPPPESFSLTDLDPTLREKVVQEIATLSETSPSAIKDEDLLSANLGLDSLDVSQLAGFLKEEFGVQHVYTPHLESVASVLAYAAKIKKEEDGGPEEGEEEPIEKIKWNEEGSRPALQYPEGRLIPEIFLNTCGRMGGSLACVDAMAGEVSYRKLKMGVLLFAEFFRKLPAKHVGVMMPASVAGNAVILALMTAGKVPVMINWTLGERNLKSIAAQSGIETTISAWNFLDRLDNVELGGLDNQILLLEEIRRDFSWRQKWKAFWGTFRKPSSLLRRFGLHRLSEDDPAVILFTSGTESLPKGVPLSHRNLIANQKDAFEMVKIRSDEVLLGVLPSFHSFGFNVTGIFPLLAGLRVAYSPNPTDGRRMALAIEKWDVTLLCLAPTFLRNLLRVAKPSQLQSLRLVVTGAEKTPADLFEKIEEMTPSAQLLEGYGITECAPILTLNPPGEKCQGVGRPLPRVEIKIVHPETHETIPIGESGLILATGPNIFSGYLDPKLASPFLEIGEKKWYLTGDLGYLDTRGYLTISGRLKRFMKIGGEMVSLAAVEEILLEAAPKMGWKLNPSEPSLAVCPKEQEGKKSELHLFTTFSPPLGEVNRVLKESGMSNLIRIRAHHAVTYIPLLATGKIDYRRLTSQLRNGI
ncbi:MAG: Bifunctional protein Aas [Chlamydiae bacterium]|nr:Bifunctional protein Aas [Chlamydiota bacterium]